jgi:hypothetical protein
VTSKPLVAATLLAFGLAGFAAAGNILSINGSDQDAQNEVGGYNISAGLEYLAQSWTQTGMYENVSVSAAFHNYLGDSSDVTAYLMNAIGPSTTVANQIALTIVSDPTSGNAMVLLFSNLDLSAGTYYLVLQGNDSSGGDLWFFTSNSNVTGAATYDGGRFSFGGEGLYAPGDNYQAYSDTSYSGRMTVTGTQAASTPEPGTVALLLGGAVLITLRRRFVK